MTKLALLCVWVLYVGVAGEDGDNASHAGMV